MQLQKKNIETRTVFFTVIEKSFIESFRISRSIEEMFANTIVYSHDIIDAATFITMQGEDYCGILSKLFLISKINIQKKDILYQYFE